MTPTDGQPDMVCKALAKYDRRVDKVNSLVCVGLDSHLDKMPERFFYLENPQFEFNRWIIAQTFPYASAYKFNMAFYEARGAQGWRELQMSMDYLHDNHPDIFTICDAKRGDIGSTNEGYRTAIFELMGFDAVTLNPYLGKEALMSFLDHADKACIILCRTSNPGAGEIQDLEVKGHPLWQFIAEKVATAWNTNGNCMVVAGATYPTELATIRTIIGEMTILTPGIGAQGGDIAATVRAGLNSRRKGLIISASRSIIFADNPGKAARHLREDIENLR